MKKLAVLFLAVVLVAAFTVPAPAMESVFNGYSRVRMYSIQNFDGNDDEVNGVPAESQDFTGVDSRTRIFYTAVINDDLKLVTKYEIDATWGSVAGAGQTRQTPSAENGYWADGDIGADGVGIEVKNAYMDFNVGPINAKLGIQGATLARGLMFADDFAGAVVSFNGEGFSIPLVWVKPYEGGRGLNRMDMDVFAVAPVFTAGGVKINPFGVYAYSERLYAWNPILLGSNGGKSPSALDVAAAETGVYYLGLDIDAKFDPVSFWLTGIYQGGSSDIAQFAKDADGKVITKDGLPLVVNENVDSIDYKAWLGAAGFKVGFGMMDIHGQAFYATGEDVTEENAGEEWNSFCVPTKSQGLTRYYAWAEILGAGVFDNYMPTNTVQFHVTNILAFGGGITVKPMDALTVTADVWHARLAEDVPVPGATDGSRDDVLGTEVDLKLTYQLVKGLNVDLIGAYLFAGDAIWGGTDDANPYEVGTQFSLSF